MKEAQKVVEIKIKEMDERSGITIAEERMKQMEKIEEIERTGMTNSTNMWKLRQRMRMDSEHNQQAVKGSCRNRTSIDISDRVRPKLRPTTNDSHDSAPPTRRLPSRQVRP